MTETCVVCDASVAEDSFQKPVDYEYDVVPTRRFAYLRCGSCASEWLEPRPSEAELLSFYPDGYHAYNKDHGVVAAALVRLRGMLRGRRLRALLPGAKGSLFDVGAGDCRHFRELSRYADVEFAGVEINARMAARAQAAGYDVETGTLESLDMARHLGRYDIVSMNHVIEHVNEPVEVARRAYALLKPGGWLIGQLPTNSSWEARLFGEAWAGYHYPRHLQVFSRTGLIGLLERAGFGEVRVRSAPHCQIAISVQNLLRALGWSPRMEFGRSPVYGLLLVACTPLEVLATAFDRSGTIDFWARRPVAYARSF